MSVTRLLGKARAFGCGAAVASLAIGAIGVVRAQGPGAPTINLCFGPNSDLRLVPPREPCRPDERRVQVKQPDPKPKEDPQRDSRVAALKRRLDALEERSRRGRLVPTRVVAPFRVIDHDKQLLFEIKEEEAILYSKARQPIAWINADNSGGSLHVMTAGSAKSAMLGAVDTRAHFLIVEGGKTRLDLGRRADGMYGLKMFTKASQVAAYIGQSDKGNGLAFVADKTGKRGVEAFADEAKQTGRVTVLNKKGVAVATMYGGAEGDGNLTLSDASGSPRVEAGVTDTGRGVVRTGPAMWNSNAGFMGIAPSYILGDTK